MNVLARRTSILGFCGAFFLLQGAGIVVSNVRGDRRFAYQMFAETTFFEARLLRVLPDGRIVPTQRGVWTVTSPDGKPVMLSWSEHIRDFKIDRLEQRTRAKIGIGVTLTMLQHALDYLAAHVPADRETDKLRLEVVWDKAGGGKGSAVLESVIARPSPGPGAHGLDR